MEPGDDVGLTNGVRADWNHVNGVHTEVVDETMASGECTDKIPFLLQSSHCTTAVASFTTALGTLLTLASGTL